MQEYKLYTCKRKELNLTIKIVYPVYPKIKIIIVYKKIIVYLKIKTKKLNLKTRKNLHLKTKKIITKKIRKKLSSRLQIM